MEREIEEVKFVQEADSAWVSFMARFLPTDDPWFSNREKWNKAFNELIEQVSREAFIDGYHACLRNHQKTIENAPRLLELLDSRMKRLRAVHDHPDTPESVRKLINLPGFMRGGLG